MIALTSYDDKGRLTGYIYPDGTSVEQTLSSINFSGAAIGNMSYSWANTKTTPNENKTGETITGTMSGYGFSIPTSGYRPRCCT